jgi:hypothetical protein
MAWVSGWSYRKTVSITGQTGAGTDYQVNLSIGDSSGGDFHLESHCTSFPNDIQVTDNDQTTPLDYWVEDLTVDPLTMWVEVADDLGSNADVCVYYGKSGESSASNGANTFLFFDDFPGAALDGDKWNSTGTPVVSGGAVSLNDDECIYTKTTYGYNTAVRAKSKANEQDIVFVSYRSSAGIFDNDVINIFNSDAAPDDFDLFHLSTERYGPHESCSSNDMADFRNTYYPYEITRISGSVSGYQNNILICTMTSELPTTNLAIGFVVWDSSQESTLDVDWVFARNFLSPTEPAFSSAGGEESAPSVGQPTMARWHGIPGMNYTGRAGVSW